MAQDKLPDLPVSSDKFWGGDKEMVELTTPVGCDHHFIRISGNEAECKNCRVGFFLGGDDIIREGHLYKGDDKLI